MTQVPAIVQARTGSTRLPRKVLQDIEGKTMLARVVERARRATRLSEVVIATSTAPDDDDVAAEARKIGVRVFRGSENDVLDRYHATALALGSPEAMVRITADCPLLDPEVVDDVVARFLAERPDYASSALVRRYPRGLDCECFSFAAFERAWREATTPADRQHVTSFLYSTPGRFKTLAVTGPEDHSRLRLTVDTPEDLELVRAIYSRLGRDGNFGWREVVEILTREPALQRINAHVEQKKAGEI